MVTTSILETMGGSPLAAIAEYNRRLRTGDTLFTSVGIYFFELEVSAPAGVGGMTRFLFPLVLNPETYDMDEPFDVEMTKGLDAGLYVEENGIVERHIRMQGHTGFKPKPFPKAAGSVSGPKALALLSTEKRSFSRALAPDILDRLSGQMHFQYLQDAVFRTYGDLKRDPATAEGTRLFFHNPKEREHWLVVPMKFQVSQAADRGPVYRYDIDLLVVDRADAVKFDVSEDASVIDNLRDALSMLVKARAMVRGTLTDLEGVVGQIESHVPSIREILGRASQSLNAVDNYVDGVTSLILTPRSNILTALSLLERGMGMAQDYVTKAEAVGDAYTQLPDDVKNTMRKLADGMVQMAVHASLFETQAQQSMRETLERQTVISTVSSSELSSALEQDAPTKFADFREVGTGLTKGEAQAVDEGSESIPSPLKIYTGSLEHSVARGDTLVNLAAAYLGDARLWRYIAAANGMKPPFINEQADLSLTPADDEALPSSLGVGQKILVPTFAKPPEAQPLLAVLGVAQDATAEAHLLGEDLELEAFGRNLYDVKIDTEHGSLGASTVQGVTNLQQAIILRLRTERGRDVLYKNVGLERVVGFNILPLDLETVLFRVSSTVEADPRIGAIRKVDIQPSNSPVDLVELDIDAEVRGFIEPVTVQTKL